MIAWLKSTPRRVWDQWRQPPLSRESIINAVVYGATFGLANELLQIWLDPVPVAALAAGISMLVFTAFVLATRRPH